MTAPNLTIQRSVFVSSIAIISAGIALLLFGSDFIALISTISLMSSPTYKFATEQLRTFAPDAGSGLLDSTWLIVGTVVSLVLNALSVASAVGLFLRKSWGRVSFIGLAWLQVLFYLVSSVVTYLKARSFAGSGGIGQLFDSSAMLLMGEYALVIGALVALSIASFLTWKLSRAEIKAEFLSVPAGPSSAIQGGMQR